MTKESVSVGQNADPIRDQFTPVDFCAVCNYRVHQTGSAVCAVCAHAGFSDSGERFYIYYMGADTESRFFTRLESTPRGDYVFKFARRSQLGPKNRPLFFPSADRANAYLKRHGAGLGSLYVKKWGDL